LGDLTFDLLVVRRLEQDEEADDELSKDAWKDWKAEKQKKEKTNKDKGKEREKNKAKEKKAGIFTKMRRVQLISGKIADKIEPIRACVLSSFTSAVSWPCFKSLLIACGACQFVGLEGPQEVQGGHVHADLRHSPVPLRLVLVVLPLRTPQSRYATGTISSRTELLSASLPLCVFWY
jgi:hypothetical protein